MPKDSPAPWVSVRAVTWVLDEAPDVPPQLVAVLIGIARHAKDDGSDSYASEATLARYARKSVRSVQRDLAQLLELGLIRIPADQSAAEHIRADRRPTVYDLAYAPPRPDAHDTTSTSGRRTTRRTRRVVDDRTTRRTRPHDPTHTSSEEDIEEDRKRSPRAEATVREFTDATDEETKELLRRIDAKHKPGSLTAYVQRMGEEGDLKQWLYDLRAEASSDAVDQARQGPPCPHGQPGGASPHPQTGQPLCPICRAHVTACRRDPLYCPTCQNIREAAGLPPDPRSRPEES